MKRLLSICCIVVLCFSLFGYRVVIDLLQEAEARAMTLQIDREAYKQQDLVSLKVPVTLPYYTNSDLFEPISGEVTIEGTIYQYVKRRIYQDSIEYLCLRDPGKTKILGAREQFYQLAYDLQSGKTQKGRSLVIKPLLLEYCDLGIPLLTTSPGMERAEFPPFYQGYYTTPEPQLAPKPPETENISELC